MLSANVRIKSVSASAFGLLLSGTLLSATRHDPSGNCSAGASGCEAEVAVSASPFGLLLSGTLLCTTRHDPSGNCFAGASGYEAEVAVSASAFGLVLSGTLLSATRHDPSGNCFAGASGCEAEFAVLARRSFRGSWREDVRQWLEMTHPGRQIGRRERSAWPSRSPDLTPTEFLLCEHLKWHVYAVLPRTIEDLVGRLCGNVQCQHVTAYLREFRATQCPLQ
jgi:hypothetical protein